MILKNPALNESGVEYEPPAVVDEPGWRGYDPEPQFVPPMVAATSNAIQIMFADIFIIVNPRALESCLVTEAEVVVPEQSVASAAPTLPIRTVAASAAAWIFRSILVSMFQKNPDAVRRRASSLG